MTTPRTQRRRAQRQRAKAAAAAAARADVAPDPLTLLRRLPLELQADIHRRGLPFLTRLAVASAVCAASGSASLLKPEAPWLVLPGKADDDGDERATLVSVADGGAAAAVRATAPAMRGHVVLGSGGGWLVTADARGALRMANPATGAQADLPPITTIPFLARRTDDSGGHFTLAAEPFLQLRYGGRPPPADETSTWAPIPARSSTLAASQMRQWFYRKVVLAASPRPDSYAAMLLLDPSLGSPAFATAEDPVWRVTPHRDGVEDAIHHDGRFYSISYSGVVEAWDRDADTGEFTSTVVTRRLQAANPGDGDKPCRKYLAVAPDGRLVAVVKGAMEEPPYFRRRSETAPPVAFAVHVYDGERGAWERARGGGVAGDAAVAGCVYYADDELGEAALRHELQEPYEPYGKYHAVYGKDATAELRHVGVYSLRTGTAEAVADLGEHRCWPPPAWVTPSFI
ncbi:hypothetical protein ACP4OV_029059 [Aristida adscensionis]